MRRNKPLTQITLTYEDGTTRDLLHPQGAQEQLTCRELALDLVQAVIDEGHHLTWLTLQQLAECAHARYQDEVREFTRDRTVQPTPIHPNVHTDMPVVGCTLIDDRTSEMGLRPFNANFTPEQHALPEADQWKVVVLDLVCKGLPLMMYQGDLDTAFTSGRVAALYVIFGRLCYQDGRSVPLPHPQHGHNVVAILTDEFRRLYGQHPVDDVSVID